MDQPKTGVWTSARISGRTDKPLGRGLEDVSHLFLTRRTDEIGGSDPASDPSPDRAHPLDRGPAPTTRVASGDGCSEPALPTSPVGSPHQVFSQSGAPYSAAAPRRSALPESQSRTVLLQPCTSPAKDVLGVMLRGLEGALEEGLRGIDASIPCPPCGEIDFLALDRTRQLAIIDFDTTPNDGLLLRGIGHFDWVMRNMPNVRRMYSGRAINFLAQPRLFLLAPQFSPLLRTVAPRIARPHINWVRYHLVSSSGGTGILFEYIVSE